MALKRAAHTLKGAVATFGARPAFDAALHVERLAGQADLSAAEPACEALAEAITRVRTSLAALAGQAAVGS